MKKQKNHKNTKMDILNTARELFETQGYNKTTIRQIIKKAGVTTGSLYHFYSNKDDILLNITNDYFEAVITKANELAHEYNEPLLGFSLDASIIFHLMDRHKTLEELLLTSYNSPFVSAQIINLASNATKKWFGAYNPSFAHCEYYNRSVLIRGIFHGLLNDHLYESAIPLKDKIDLLITTVNQMFNVPNEKIQKLLLQTEKIINENKITILDYKI
ncbi:TetR/AcrR family transcriptional regulator [Oceanirhabdus seepicola]|uniref:TetR/AcrR family transcriptional regulator n=1 Tax=Oceanirhabdus seepicola TaxID=2828781 RepID=A0A9J6P3G0_9CLOT|nr:TetR/AcrR family transcriptional regulator [Oceanirhabdus seepicola]MCM1990349.1 TetR/AcrR family transcriptional regulator [Oceanirhabdus seepicola]